MKGDFSRLTFRGRHHYRGVLQQQGRVQLDAEWNEQVLLQAHLDRLSARDTVGLHGAPLDAAGMQIVDTQGQPLVGPVDAAELCISPGRYYVSGILCENEDLVPLDDQPDLLGVSLPYVNGHYIAYLDAWHEHLTAREEPALREVALGGPDTTTRSRTIWQVRVRPAAQPGTTPSGGGMRARASGVDDILDICDVPSGTGYRRLDNQLYRVEIVDPGDAGVATYVWSRENGSVTAQLIDLDGDVLTLDSTGRDDRLSFDKGWVEVTTTARVRRGESGFFGSIGHVQNPTVTVAQWVDDAPPPDVLHEGAIVRRWESVPTVVTLPDADQWTSLESGVQIQFVGADFRTGDYWLVPARTANLEGNPAVPGLAGDIDWPHDADGPFFQPPAGIRHFYAEIADLELGDQGWTVNDRRPVFPPLTDARGAISVGYAGGDGQQMRPGTVLPQPLEVSVTLRGSAVQGAAVLFEAADAGGRLAASPGELPGIDSSVVIPTDGDGVAKCWWLPADDPALPGQRVTARSIGPGGLPVEPRVDFSTAFALDEGLQVVGVRLTDPGRPLPNDALLTAEELAGGLAVLLDGAPDAAAVTGKRVLTVTLDLPFPLTEADRALWGGSVAGTVPLTLAGTVGTGAAGGSPSVTWTAADGTGPLLSTLFVVLTRAKASDRVLTQLTLDGRVTGTAGWTQWCWLVESIGQLMLVPKRQGRLSRVSGRQLVTQAASRDALRAALPAGAHVADAPGQDDDVVRRAAGNAFRNGAPRALVLVVPDRFAAAARAIGDAMAGLAQVVLEVIATANPVAETEARIAAGEPVDGILTDAAHVDDALALPDFGEEFPL